MNIVGCLNPPFPPWESSNTRNGGFLSKIAYLFPIIFHDDLTTWFNHVTTWYVAGNPCPDFEKPFPCKSTSTCIPMGYVCDWRKCTTGYAGQSTEVYPDVPGAHTVNITEVYLWKYRGVPGWPRLRVWLTWVYHEQYRGVAVRCTRKSTEVYPGVPGLRVWL